MIAALVAVVVASPGVASVDAAGEVSVWRAETGRRTAIYQCRQRHVGPSRLAWAGPVLFIACPGEVLASWEVGESSARPVANQALARRRPALLGDGDRALFFAEANAVWRYRPTLDLVERIGPAPAWPLAALRQTPIGLIARSGHACWQWRRRGWRRLTGPLREAKPHSSTGPSRGALCEDMFAAQGNYTRKLAKRVRDRSGRDVFITSYKAAWPVQCLGAMLTAHPTQESSVADRTKAVQILAKSIFRELTSQGYSEKQIVSLATALLNEVTVKISSSEASVRP